MQEIISVLWYNKTLCMDHVALSAGQEVTDYKSPCLCRAGNRQVEMEVFVFERIEELPESLKSLQSWWKGVKLWSIQGTLGSEGLLEQFPSIPRRKHGLIEELSNPVLYLWVGTSVPSRPTAQSKQEQYMFTFHALEGEINSKSKHLLFQS